VDTSVYLPDSGVAKIPEAVVMNRVEAWATFLLVVVAGLILLSFMGVVVGPWFDHLFSGIFHTLGAPLVLRR
jgi:Trk-type K+ transport system membrane component